MAQPPQPKLLGEHDNIRFHDEGGMSWVFVAEHVALQRREAIKLLKPEASASERQMFMREGRILAKLNHDFICQVFDVKESPDGPYLRMEFIDGPTLRQRIDRESLSISQSVEIVLSLANALALAHSKRIIHSDLKPENVLFETSSNRPKLIDFGIARRFANEGGPRTEGDTRVRGTPAYISPEQLRGERPSPGSDLYSLGVMFFELLVGRLPFQGSRDELVHAHLELQPPPLPPSLGDLQPVMDRLLAKHAIDRYEDCSAFDHALILTLAGSPKLKGHIPRGRVVPANVKAAAATPPVPPQSKPGTTQYFSAPKRTHETRPQVSASSEQSPQPSEDLRLRARQLLERLSSGSASAALKFQFVANLLQAIEASESSAAIALARTLMGDGARLLGNQVDLSVAAVALEQREAELHGAQAADALARSQAAAGRGNWLPPELGNALDEATLATSLDAENRAAKEWLSSIPSEIALVIAELTEGNKLDAGLELATRALAHFPGNKQLAAQLKAVGGAIQREAARREKDAAMFTLAAELPQDPGRHAPTAVLRLIATAEIDLTRPGARSLLRELHAWLERMAATENIEQLEAAKASVGDKWEELHRIPSLGATVNRAEAKLISLQRRRTMELRRASLISQLHAACNAEGIFDASPSGLLARIRAANDSGFASDAERVLRANAPFLEEVMVAAVRTGTPDAATLDEWLSSAEQAFRIDSLLRRLVEIREFAQGERELEERLAALAARISSSVPPDDAMLKPIADIRLFARFESSASIQASIDRILDATRTAIEHCDSREHLGLLDEIWSRIAALPGKNNRIVRLAAVQKTAKDAFDRFQRVDVDAAANHAIEVFLVHPGIDNLRALAGHQRALNDKPTSLAAVIASVETQLTRLIVEKQWATHEAWLESARGIFPPAVSLRFEQLRDSARAKIVHEEARLRTQRLHGLIHAFRDDPATRAVDVATAITTQSAADREHPALHELREALAGWLDALDDDLLPAAVDGLRHLWPLLSGDDQFRPSALRIEARLTSVRHRADLAKRTVAKLSAMIGGLTLDNVFDSGPSGLLPVLLEAQQSRLLAVVVPRVNEQLPLIEQAITDAASNDNLQPTSLDNWVNEVARIIGSSEISQRLTAARVRLAAKPDREEFRAKARIHDREANCTDVIRDFQTSPTLVGLRELVEANRNQRIDDKALHGIHDVLQKHLATLRREAQWEAHAQWLESARLLFAAELQVDLPVIGAVNQISSSVAQGEDAPGIGAVGNAVPRTHPTARDLATAAERKPLPERRARKRSGWGAWLIAATVLLIVVVNLRPFRSPSEPVVADAPKFTIGQRFQDPLRIGGSGPQMVVVTANIAAGMNEVTVGDFRAFSRHRVDPPSAADRRCEAWDSGISAWHMQAGLDWSNPGHTQTDRHPVVCVTWDDAQEYAKWLSLQTGETYRIPTASERSLLLDDQLGKGRDICSWANIADQTADASGALITDSADCSDGHWYPAEVGSFSSNSFGLNDLVGNVWEWLADCKDSIGNSEPGSSCGKRMVAGGSWLDTREKLATTNVFAYPSGTRNDSVGFRVIRELPR